MKITITIPDSVWIKLESDRGLVPRSTWIQELIISKNKATFDTYRKGPYVREKGEKYDFAKRATKKDIEALTKEYEKEERLEKLVNSGIVKKGVPADVDTKEFTAHFKDDKLNKSINEN